MAAPWPWAYRLSPGSSFWAMHGGMDYEAPCGGGCWLLLEKCWTETERWCYAGYDVNQSAESNQSNQSAEKIMLKDQSNQSGSGLFCLRFWGTSIKPRWRKNVRSQVVDDQEHKFQWRKSDQKREDRWFFWVLDEILWFLWSHFLDFYEFMIIYFYFYDNLFAIKFAELQLKNGWPGHCPGVPMNLRNTRCHVRGPATDPEPTQRCHSRHRRGGAAERCPGPGGLLVWELSEGITEELLELEKLRTGNISCISNIYLIYHIYIYINWVELSRLKLNDEIFEVDELVEKDPWKLSCERFPRCGVAQAL